MLSAVDRARSSGQRRRPIAVSVALLLGAAAACSNTTPAATPSGATRATTSPSAASSTDHAAQPPLSTALAPWPDPDQVQDRVGAAGLTGGGEEMLTVHYHAHLDVFVDGAAEPVAASIGREDHSFYSPLHTHATSGMIHIEAAREEQLTLGMLFTEWGVRLTDTCIGGYCTPAVPISAYVNGRPTPAPIPSIVFRKGDEIALVIGSPPAAIPSAWDCAANIDPDIENPAQCADFS